MGRMQWRLFTRRGSTLVLAALLLMAGSCRSADEEPSGGGQSLQEVQMTGALAYELMLPSMVALANGYYEENGIDLSITPSSGSDARQGLMAGDFDFGLLASVHVPIARLGGVPLTAVASMHDLEIFSLVVRSGLKDQVHSVEDLRGLKVGFSDPGAGSWYMGGVFLKRAGLDPEKDLEYLSIGADPAVIVTSLESGRVDAFASWEPTTTKVIEEGIAFPVVDIWNPATHSELVGEKALSMVLTTREDVIQEQPELVQKMVDATLMGLEDIRSMSSEEIADLVMAHEKTAALFEGLDRDVVVSIFDKIKSGFGDGCLSRSGYQTELDILIEFQVVEEEVPFEEFADTTWAGECA